MRGEFLDLDGARVYYYAAGSRGSGEPIVLLHGFPTCGHLWAEVVPLLPPGHRVVVVDLLGFGRSDPPGTQPVTLRGHAERTVALLDTLGINHACVAGHDVGGGVAQVMAVRWPHRVSRLALVDSVAYDCWPRRVVTLARAMLPLTRLLPPGLLLSILRRDLARGYDDAARGTRSIEKYLRAFAGEEGRDACMRHLQALDAGETTAIAGALRTLVQPTAIVWGALDPFLPVTIGRRLAGDIPGATLDVVERAGHFTPEEAPARVAAAIAQLLAR
ncbi:MAG: alpha/beta fold hydrolase [Gemmatimonadaceae bacterium]